ncbi:hypothetical protein ASG99_10400 [Bacillus sp. Soil768D1]|nr:hypothetical protein ASG99_10400 [Bacillus sp. Soil768D1]
MSFAEANKQDVKLGFAKDLATCTPQEIYREWFSINGGGKFGHSRLGYFIDWVINFLLLIYLNFQKIEIILL